MLKLYGIPNCNMVKKARGWLDANGTPYTFHDFRKDGVDASLLHDWLKQVDWEELVNRAGMTWRTLPDPAKAAVHDDASAIALMLEKPSVIKRPVMAKDGRIVQLGFSESAYQKLQP
jgi:Spx/MgsR family transcriptional regulator